MQTTAAVGMGYLFGAPDAGVIVGISPNGTVGIIGTYGLFQAAGSYNPVTGDGSVNIGVGLTFYTNATAPPGIGVVNMFGGFGVDQSGDIYFTLQFANVYHVGHSPTSPGQAGGGVTLTFSLGNVANYPQFYDPESGQFTDPMGIVHNLADPDPLPPLVPPPLDLIPLPLSPIGPGDPELPLTLPPPAGPAYPGQSSDDLSNAQKEPLVIDIAGDGLNLTAESQDPTYFDWSGGNFKNRTGWIGAGAGFLVIAPTNGGTITEANLVTSFAQLQALDINHTSTLTSADPGFATLEVWEDTNGDGVAQPGELFTLAQLGIQSINLGDQTTSQIVSGNTIEAVSSVTMTNGSTQEIAAVNFAYSQTYTEVRRPRHAERDRGGAAATARLRQPAGLAGSHDQRPDAARAGAELRADVAHRQLGARHGHREHHVRMGRRRRRGPNQSWAGVRCPRTWFPRTVSRHALPRCTWPGRSHLCAGADQPGAVMERGVRWHRRATGPRRGHRRRAACGQRGCAG